MPRGLAVPDRLPPSCSLGIAAVTVLLDYAVGPRIEFPAIFLVGLLPICSYGKRIRDDAGHWQRLEKYIQERSAATFTHGVCETCLHDQLSKGDWRRSG